MLQNYFWLGRYQVSNCNFVIFFVISIFIEVQVGKRGQVDVIKMSAFILPATPYCVFANVQLCVSGMGFPKRGHVKSRLSYVFLQEA